MAKKILFIGGTGIISSASAERVLEQGDELYIFNRGRSRQSRPVPDGAVLLLGDYHNSDEISAVTAKHEFDVVVNWIAFHPDNCKQDYELFSGRVGQYVFISSASAYQKPVEALPITEETPLDNPFWEYSRNKVACEVYLNSKHDSTRFPVTVVRPSHTYDKTLFPFRGGYTIADRMRKGKPVIIHGDGTSLWVLTHHQDFAKGFVGLLGNPHAVGESFQITSDELLPWNKIFRLTAEAAGADLNALHVPSDVIARYDADWGASLLGDKSHSVIFDNSKIKKLVPDFSADIRFEEGIQEIMAWYDADPARQVLDLKYNQILDKIAADYA